MSNSKNGLESLTLLGNQNTRYTFSYQPEILEKIPNAHSHRDFFVKFNCPEFTSLCPKT